jgi:hypothetical protein
MATVFGHPTAWPSNELTAASKVALTSSLHIALSSEGLGIETNA